MGSIANLIGDLKVLVTAATLKPPEPDSIGSFGLLVQQHADSHPHGVALLCEDEVVTWQELNERTNRVAAILKAQGILPGDCVSLFMQNRIEFVVQIAAITRLGAIGGLINTNLSKKQLVHCIALTESKKCIFGEELIEPLNEIRHALDLKDGEDYLFVRDQGVEAPPAWSTLLDSEDENTDAGNHPESETITLGHTAFYIFTSGTTGLPKAAVMSSKRVMQTAMLSSTALLRIKRTDRMYNCLPLYHATGLVVGLTAAFQVGASSVIRRRLSVSAFWNDVRKYNCTTFVYIGEFLRYLMSPPEETTDKENPIRAIVGNGLRPDIWLNFKQRFGIDRIGEFYGASDGNGGFGNVFNKDCTVGLSLVPTKIIKYDVANDEILRDSAGMCIEVADGEAGLLLIEVTEKSQFEGYTTEEATKKKLIQNAFKQGDVYFNSGDIMKSVDVGFSYGQTHYQFVDRVGDTFRWKSENVSTNEVGEIINNHDEIIFSNIYGVEIPGTDGRAGMASIVLRDGLDNLDLNRFSAHISGNLPAYARPIFIRILDELPTTTTHKLQKQDLRDQAYHLDKVDNELLVMKPGETAYSKLDSDFYDRIIRREIAF